jgi:hypothetical protein
VEFERITVFTRDAYRGAQEPLRFCWREQWFDVERVLDRWYEGRMDSTRLPLRYFRVETSAGVQWILRYHEFFDAWSLLLPAREDQR